jgi:hypothetical protein
MKAKFRVGDRVTVNAKYLREGRRYFGRELKYIKLLGKIVTVHENTNNEKDGQGDIWKNFYEVNGGVLICEAFLRLA